MSVSTATDGSRSLRVNSPRRWQVGATVVVFGVAAFLLGRVLWPDPLGSPTPPPFLLPIFIAISALEALLFGVGIAFVLFARRWLLADGSKLGVAAFVAIAWTLVSWWPHDNFHRVTHDWTGLAAIEIGFHVTLIISILIISAFFVRTLQAQSAR